MRQDHEIQYIVLLHMYMYISIQQNKLDAVSRLYIACLLER